MNDPMTLDDLLAWSRHVIEANGNAYVHRAPGPADVLMIANAIESTLGESQPCGCEPPDLAPAPDGRIGIVLRDLSDVPSTTDEARAWAAMILRRAEDADAANQKES